jgi:hypothetical protein
MKHLTTSRTFRTYSPNGSPFSMVPLAIALGLFTAVACGGTVDAGGGKSGVTGGGGASGTDAGAATLDPVASCEDYFTKVVQPCGLEGVSQALPASEMARVLGLYRKSCAARLALPGTGFTPTAIAACVSDVEAKGCSAAQSYGHTGPNCAFLGGTLPGSAACSMGEQCAAGVCNATAPMGPSSGASCGTCATPGPKGQQCATPLASMPGQPPGAPSGGLSITPGACSADEDCDAMNTGRCIPLGDKVGASCLPTSAGPFVRGCTSGLYCDDATQKCVAERVAGKGESCGSTGTVCAAHLVCTGDPGIPTKGPPGGPGGPGGPPAPPAPSPMTCKDPGAAGATCFGDSQCASGLGCVGDCQQGGAACSCTVVTLADPGEPCDTLVRCRVGFCPGSGARCVTVIPDGQACIGASALGPPGTQDTCEPFSNCVAGKCTPGYPTCQ